MPRTTVLLAVICAILIGLGSWVKTEHSKSSHEQVRTPGQSDYYMKGATVYQLTDQGQLAYRMKIAKTLHYADKSSNLSDIHMHYVKNTPTYWNLDAAQGHVPAGKREIYLYGGVVVHHPYQKNGDILTAHTDHAWVRPRIDRVDSDAHVTAVDPSRTTSGDGMRINLKTNKLNLLDNVHSTMH